MENENTPDVLLGVVNPPSENPRSVILTEALDIVNGERERDYGPPTENLARIRDFWNTYLSSVLGYKVELKSRNVAELMVLVKVARLIQSPTKDSYVDMAGYAALSYEASVEEERKA